MKKLLTALVLSFMLFLPSFAYGDSLIERQVKFSGMVSDLLEYAECNDIKVTLGETTRSVAEQKNYVKEGKSKTLKSKHLSGLAVDLNLFVENSGKWKYITDGKEYKVLGVYWESLGGTWGGRFGVSSDNYDKEVGWDANHFEY